MNPAGNHQKKMKIAYINRFGNFVYVDAADAAAQIAAGTANEMLTAAAAAKGITAENAASYEAPVEAPAEPARSTYRRSVPATYTAQVEEAGDINNLLRRSGNAACIG